MPQMPIEELREILDYKPETGEFFWRPRPRSAFNNPGNYRSFQVRMEGKRVNRISSEGYVVVRHIGQRFQAHRLAWAHFYGVWPATMIDHINHNRADNRILNLREVSAAENARNACRYRTNTSGITGVSWDARWNRWRAYIRHEKHVDLGSFRDQLDAICARKSAEIEFGFHPNHGK